MSLMGDATELKGRLTQLGHQPNWNLTAVRRLDSAAAVLLWRAWGRRWPEQLQVNDTVRTTLERVANLPLEKVVPPSYHQSPVLRLGRLMHK